MMGGHELLKKWLLVSGVASSVLPGFPMTSDFSTWYTGNRFFPLGTVPGPAAYALRTALAGQSILRDGVLER